MIDFNDYTWTQLTASMGYNRDGVHGAFLNGKHRIWGGWSTGTTTFNTQYSSTNAVTWDLEANAPWTGRHTVAYTIVNGEAYMVNGDVYNLGNDGILATESWKFDGTTWTLIAANNGLGGYSLGSLDYLDGSFYFTGGQLSVLPNSKRSEVWKSTNGCVSFTKISDTPFAEGLVWGNMCVFNGKIWKIGGATYSNTLNLRTYPRKIYSSTDGVTWDLEGKMPYAMKGRHYSQMCLFNNVLWMIGGFNGYYGLNIQEVWASEDGITWSVQTPPFAAKHGMTVWTHTDGLYAGWGSNNATVVSDVWKLTIN